MNMMIPLSEFQQRRQQLLQQLEATGTKAVAVVAAAQLQTRSRDTEYPFRQDSDFYYLTGFNEPNALLVLAPHAEHPVQLFCQPNDALAETWQGRRLGIERAVAELGVDYCASIDDVHTHLIKLLDGVERVYHHHQHDALTHQLHAVAAELRAAPKRGFQAPVGWIDLQPWLADMRMIKSANELNVMREAARISVLGHQRAMRFAQPNRYEYQVAAEIHHEFAMHGALAPAYNTICGSGENACILHYTDNCAQLQDGELLLIDAGAEYQGYAGDITRTFPVNGRFAPYQRDLYNVVLAAQEAALATLKPGSDIQTALLAAGKALTEGLLELGILQGSYADLLAEQAYRRFMIHGLGHWLGLDVHDVGTYSQAGKNRPFEPGMVLTIEPGVYIPHGMTGVAEQWHGIGIRIEDNVIITASGYENMTAAAPKTVAEIEQWMKQ